MSLDVTKRSEMCAAIGRATPALTAQRRVQLCKCLCRCELSRRMQSKNVAKSKGLQMGGSPLQWVNERVFLLKWGSTLDTKGMPVGNGD